MYRMQPGRPSLLECALVPRLVQHALIALALATLSFRADGRAQGRPLKVFISADMEGIAGVVQPSQLGPTGFEYGKAREWMTGEVKTAVAAAKAAGAAEIVVADSHGNAQNLLIDDLPADVQVVRGFPRPLSMMQGIGPDVGAVIFIGYHASEYGRDAVRGHTFSSARLLHVKLNGTEVSEGIFNAAIAGHFNVPVAFVSGDREAVAQLKAAIPSIEGLVVKDGLGYHSAQTTTPARSREMIQQGVTEALKRLASHQPYRVKTPIELEVGFKLTLDAERASYVPGLSRVDAHAVRGTLPDMVQITRLIQVLTSLEPPP
jgi:D-amino peptidase